MFSLKGYKTYIGAVLVVLSGLLYWVGAIDQVAFVSLLAIFGGTATFGFRSAIVESKK